jgi:hypothetical protein
VGEVGSRRNLAAALVFVVAAACSQSPEDRGPTATAPSVPEVIDIAYVNRVLAGLDAVMGDVVRLVVKTKTIPPEAYDRLRAIYGDDEWLQLRVDGFQEDLRTGVEGYRPEPGNERTVVAQLLSTTPTCVFAKVLRDSSAMVANAGSLSTQWVALIRAHASEGSINPTGWVYTYDGFPQDRSEPPNRCTARS